MASVERQPWVIDVEGGSYEIAEEPAWEAVRFELEHPASIHGFEIMWDNLPADGLPTDGLEAGRAGYPCSVASRWPPPGKQIRVLLGT